MGLTQKERSAKIYKYRKNNGLCPRCGKSLDRDGHYCSECLEKVRIYVRSNRAFYRENHICTACGKQVVYGSDRICPECRAKMQERRKPLTDEQKQRYGIRFRKQQNDLYKQRVEEGICTRCGMRKAEYGRKKCDICLSKDAELHRKKNMSRVNIKEYRKENHLCYYCGEKNDSKSGQVCTACLEKRRLDGLKSSGMGKNQYWRNDNKLVFKNN